MSADKITRFYDRGRNRPLRDHSRPTDSLGVNWDARRGEKMWSSNSLLPYFDKEGSWRRKDKGIKRGSN